MTAQPRAFAVVVPARDEASTIEACVRSIRRAAARLPAGVGCTVLVVADACTDRTERVAADSGAVTLRGAWGNVGRSRAAGADAVLRALGTPGVWLACTDADSQVPADWLSHHLRAARHGWQGVLGTVRLAGTPAPALWSGFERSYRRGDGHPHVHGANLAVDAARYRQAGGFPPLCTGEDTALVRRLRHTGAPLLATGEAAVWTSARRDGRAPGGFARDVRRLSDVDTSRTRPGFGIAPLGMR